MFRIRFFFFFNDTATTEIYTLSLHDALPILDRRVELLQPQARVPEPRRRHLQPFGEPRPALGGPHQDEDRKSTRLNSSHANISYAVFCLKKKNTTPIHISRH